MSSPASVQVFPNDKKAKKKNPKYKSNKEKDLTTSFGKNEKENISAESKNESTERRHFNFGDLKDFPELKVSEKSKSSFCFENNKNGLKTEKPWLTSFCSGNKKKLSEPFPALPSVSNLQKNEINFSKEKDKPIKTILENNTSEMIIKVEVNKKNNNDPYTTKEKKVLPLAKTSVKPARNPNKKKRTDPVFINFQDILAIKKIKKKTKQHSIHRSKIQRPKDKEFLSGNILDSSNPIRSRGKHREIKKQKLSKFKITIIKERLLKQKMREIEAGSHSEYDSFNLIDKIDFNKEIKTYLDQLKEKKLKNSKSKQNETNANININKINKQKQENTDTKLPQEKEKHLENIKTFYFKDKQIPQTTAEGEVKFSSKFREYCDNVLTPDLNLAVSELIKGLILLQDKLFSRDPVKARAKKRHVSGIREVKKHLNLKKAKMIIIAPNLEKLQMEGSVYDSINELKSMAVSQNVPYGFALDRYKLGRCTKKNAPVSAFAVLNYEGIEELYEKALHQLFESKKKFSELITPKKVAVDSDNVNSKVISSLVSVFREKLQVSSESQTQID